MLPFITVPGAKQKRRVQNVLQFATVCCSVLRGVAVQGVEQKWSVPHRIWCSMLLQWVAVCCSVLQYTGAGSGGRRMKSVEGFEHVAVCVAGYWLKTQIRCSVLLQCVVAVSCSKMQRVAACCSVLQRVAVCCCSVLQ